MDPNSAPEVVFCPRCLCPLNPRQTYPVNFYLPAQPPPLPTDPNQGPINQHLNQGPTDQHPTDGTVHPMPPPVYRWGNTPTPPPEPPAHTQFPEREGGHSIHSESHRTSASSLSSRETTYSAFSDYSINTAFAAELRAVEENYFPWQPSRESSSPLPPMSSPSTEFSLVLSTIPTSSPSTESSMTLLTQDELLPIMRRWVVFRGRVPGVYLSL